MHERPAGKIRLYTRFFDYANFRLPLSTFLVDVLRHLRINISQLSIIGAAKVDDFTCHASFLWHTAKHVTRDHDPVAADFNAHDYTTLVAHPSPFRKFSEAFLCLVGLSRHCTLDEETYLVFLHKNGEEMDIFAFIHTLNPTKVRVVERERNEDEPRLLDTTVGRTVPLLLVAPDRAESELEAIGGQDANIHPVVEAADTVVEDMALMQSRHQGKRKSVVVDVGAASHPPKKLREDHGTPGGTSVGGKSRSAIKRLLVGAMLNAEVGVAAIPTLPFVTTSVSSMPEREVGDHTDSVAKPNLRTIGASQRFVISSYSSHHSGPTSTEAKVDSLVRSSALIMTIATTITSTVDPDLIAKDKPVKPSLFSADSSSAGAADPNTGVFLDLTGSDFLVGGIRTVIDPDTDLQKFFAFVRGIEHDQLFTQFNVGAARQMSLSEVRMRAEYNVKERRRLKSVIEKQDELLKARDGEIEDLKAQLLLREIEAAEATRLRAQTSNLEAVEKSLRDEVNALKERNTILEKEQNALDVKATDLEASVVGKERDLTDLNAQLTSVKSQNDNLVDRVHELETSSAELREKVTVYDNCMEQLEKFQDDQMKVVNDKFDKLYTDFVEMTLHLEEKFYLHLLTIISGRRWLLTHGMELAIVKCLNSLKYLSTLGTAIGKSIEKGMQDGLAAGITHGKEGRVFMDVASHNPSAEGDYVSALQQLQNVNFPMLAELRSKKDASVETLMDTLHLEGPVAKKLGLNELQPNVDQLMNIANQRSVLRDVFVPLAEPFSSAVLTGAEGTSDTVASVVSTTTALSITLASASLIDPISVYDYKVVGTDDQTAADGSDASFSNVDDAELHIPQ
ncbi:hypothetical protein Tco_1204556 [Tanacetum coccineum]